MTTRHGIVAVMVAVAMATPVTGDWYSDPEWSFRAKLGTSYTLVCNDSLVNVQAGDTIEWRDPANKIITSTTANSHKYEMVAMNGVMQHSLTVKNIAEGDKGVYRCLVFRGTRYMLQAIRGLNLHHSLMSLGEVYRNNIIVAFVSAIIFAALVMLLCALMHYNYEERSETTLRSVHMDSPSTSTIPALTVTEVANEAQEANLANDTNESAKIMGGIGNPAFKYDKHAEAMGNELDTRL